MYKLSLFILLYIYISSTVGIVLLIVLRAAVVVMPVILHTLSSIFLILALQSVLLTRLLVSVALTFLTSSSYSAFLTTLFYTTSLSLLKSVGAGDNLSTSNFSNLSISYLSMFLS